VAVAAAPAGFFATADLVAAAMAGVFAAVAAEVVAGLGGATNAALVVAAVVGLAVLAVAAVVGLAEAAVAAVVGLAAAVAAVVDLVADVTVLDFGAALAAVVVSLVVDVDDGVLDLAAADDLVAAVVVVLDVDVTVLDLAGVVAAAFLDVVVTASVVTCCTASSSARLSICLSLAITMIYSKQDFRKFVQDHRNVWPCNAVRATRNNHSPAMIVCMSCVQTQSFGKPIVVPAGAFRKDAVQHLILTGQVVPVPPTVALVLDCMESHGKRASLKWCERVKHFVWRRLVTGNHIKDLYLIVHCLKHHVTELLANSVLRRDVQLLATESWVDAVIEQCECKGNRDIGGLFTCSMDCINACIEGHVSPLATASEVMARTSLNVVSP